MGCHCLLQGIFLTQGSNPCLLHGQADSLPQSHKEGLSIQSNVQKDANFFENLFIKYMVVGGNKLLCGAEHVNIKLTGEIEYLGDDIRQSLIFSQHREHIMRAMFVNS